MKTTQLIQALTAALLLTAAPTGTHAASLLEDGDFDSLPVGTAPDVGRDVGGWFLGTFERIKAKNKINY